MKITIEQVENGFIVEVEKNGTDRTQRLMELMHAYVEDSKEMLNNLGEDDEVSKLIKQSKGIDGPKGNAMQEMMQKMAEEEKGGTFIFDKETDIIGKVCELLKVSRYSNIPPPFGSCV